ncbi:MAG: hypothetical protein JGK12_14890 [Microcoleus sp. PH2017_01_SCD_O_A]|uniref:hypothetical protein n=1 Tax=unclassified Microcoleus TaxID=2642155 RepID=UPI001D893C0E|nr:MULTISPECIES: hypothetical protein [unclassified Microcoleus]MCC3448631.1 hypothetical protein [Microcoleus sp. PH2017_09_SFU_O_A]MCC3472369.1 hypothetical protein [Microcoleus sp. PH2017_13_LAR_U_A]MCC3503672.1 hypothetical protein [Microcoleus sp. PH2017_19_SFW_U_A]MCC3511393.1 hypothetical protein [Microcoleus sp. PH2017_17_BER_D_A]MCC3629516.1 hypothetical protein [Microcoleus sp. PH2017_39_LGB_O_B]
MPESGLDSGQPPSKRTVLRVALNCSLCFPETLLDSGLIHIWRSHGHCGGSHRGRSQGRSPPFLC